jgi:hypothetical protein
MVILIVGNSEEVGVFIINVLLSVILSLLYNYNKCNNDKYKFLIY